jgi:hypothetical protein
MNNEEEKRKIKEKKYKKRKRIGKISVVGGEIQLGPLGTAATNRPNVPAPADYDDG